MACRPGKTGKVRILLKPFQKLLKPTSTLIDAQLFVAVYLNDGLHLSDAGNQFVFDAISAAISKHLPHLSPSKHAAITLTAQQHW